MLLLYIKHVRQHLLKINHCENKVKLYRVHHDGTKEEWEEQCSSPNLCIDCQLYLCDLLEWAEVHFNDIRNDYSPTDSQLASVDLTHKLSNIVDIEDSSEDTELDTDSGQKSRPVPTYKKRGSKYE